MPTIDSPVPVAPPVPSAPAASAAAFDRIQILHVWESLIGPEWCGRNFFASHWRLYYNERPGAAVRLGDERVALMPDHVYAIPPATPFEGVDITRPTPHFYIHFQGGRAYDTARPQIHAVPLVEPARAVIAAMRERRVLGPLADDLTMVQATFLAAWVLAAVPASDLGGVTGDPRILAAIRSVHRHPERPIHVEELAAQQGMSRASFGRVFRAMTGSTPHAYLIHIKLSLARDLLEGSARSIDQIAAATGFADRFHFSRTFTAWLGRSPVAHRRLIHGHSGGGIAPGPGHSDVAGD